jgi:hypothetical protein
MNEQLLRINDMASQAVSIYINHETARGTPLRPDNARRLTKVALEEIIVAAQKALGDL